jgi:hypothetical protein
VDGKVLDGRDPTGLIVDYSLLATPAPDEVFARPWIDYGPDGIYSPKSHSFHPDPFITGRETSWDQDVHDRYMKEYAKRNASSPRPNIGDTFITRPLFDGDGRIIGPDLTEFGTVPNDRHYFEIITDVDDNGVVGLPHAEVHVLIFREHQAVQDQVDREYVPGLMRGYIGTLSYPGHWMVNVIGRVNTVSGEGQWTVVSYRR